MSAKFREDTVHVWVTAPGERKSWPQRAVFGATVLWTRIPWAVKIGLAAQILLALRRDFLDVAWVRCTRC